LENRVKRAVVMSVGRVIEIDDLELAGSQSGSVDLDIRAARMRAECEVIQLALAQSGGVISGAAKLLGISRPTLYTLLAEHGIGDAELTGEGTVARRANSSPA